MYVAISCHIINHFNKATYLSQNNSHHNYSIAYHEIYFDCEFVRFDYHQTFNSVSIPEIHIKWHNKQFHL